LTKPIVGMVANTLSPDLWGSEENSFAKSLNFVGGVHPYLTVMVDHQILQVDSINSRYKVALLAEPAVVERGLSQWIIKNYDKFDAIITFQKEYTKVSPKFKYCPLWIRHRLLNDTQENCRSVMKFYDKSKMISAIFSTKFLSEGHNVRRLIRRDLSDEIDIYGRGHNFIEHKIDAIKDYRYHVCVETIKESICSMLVTDAILCGTVPIYWGNDSSNISEYFNMDGIILFNSLNDLKYNIKHVISINDYKSRLPAMRENFNLAKDLNMHDLWWEYCIKDFFRN
jgi:hypothetical protein